MKVIQTKQSRSSILAMGFFVAAIVAAGASNAHGEEAAKPDREKFHAALKACASENGVKHIPGQRPSEDERKKMDACLASKGITPPPPHHPKHRHERPDRDGGPDRPPRPGGPHADQPPRPGGPGNEQGDQPPGPPPVPPPGAPPVAPPVAPEPSDS
jgi:hypothetical protein